LDSVDAKEQLVKDLPLHFKLGRGDQHRLGLHHDFHLFRPLLNKVLQPYSQYHNGIRQANARSNFDGTADFMNSRFHVVFIRNV